MLRSRVAICAIVLSACELLLPVYEDDAGSSDATATQDVVTEASLDAGVDGDASTDATTPPCSGYDGSISQTNIIVNPDFLQGGDGNSCGSGWNPDPTVISYAIVDGGYEGGRYCRVEATGGNGISHTFTTADYPAGTTFYMTAWVAACPDVDASSGRFGMVAHQDYSPNVNLYDTAIYEPTLAGSWVPGTYACALGDASLNKFEIIPNKDPDAGTSCVLVTDVWLSAQ